MNSPNSHDGLEMGWISPTEEGSGRPWTSLSTSGAPAVEPGRGQFGSEDNKHGAGCPCFGKQWLKSLSPGTLGVAGGRCGR